MNNNCIFCKIIAGEAPSVKIFENESHIAILDLFPVSQGHTLLIPKQHHVNIFDSPDDISGNTYSILVKVANALKQATGCDGMNIVQNNEACAGQIVFHSHIHLIPRYEDDNIKIAIASKERADDERQKKLAEKIKAAFVK